VEPHDLLTAAQLQAFVRHIDERLGEVRTDLRDLRTELREGFARVDTRLTHLDSRLTHLDSRLNHLDNRVERLPHADPVPTLVFLWLTAGIALAVSLFALWR
jgi:predicted nuclease with TOPRIM domain